MKTLETSLRSALQVLREDSSMATPTVEAPKPTSKDESTPLPGLKKSSTSSASSSASVQNQQKTAVSPKEAAPKVSAPEAAAVSTSIPRKVQAPPPPPPMKASAPAIQSSVPVASENEAVPIAMGLDKFLQNPKATSVEELNALRDGLIQVLAMIQTELISAATRPPVVIPQVPQPDPTQRILKQHFQPQNQQAEQATGASADVEKELKLVLALLLKHRGGPGFGHGRLQGKELDLLEEKLRNVAELLKEESTTN